MLLQNFNEVQEVLGHFEVILDHVLDLLLDDADELGCVLRLLLFTAEHHHLQSLKGHVGLLLQTAARRDGLHLRQRFKRHLRAPILKQLLGNVSLRRDRGDCDDFGGLLLVLLDTDRDDAVLIRLECDVQHFAFWESQHVGGELLVRDREDHDSLPRRFLFIAGFLARPALFGRHVDVEVAQIIVEDEPQREVQLTHVELDRFADKSSQTVLREVLRLNHVLAQVSRLGVWSLNQQCHFFKQLGYLSIVLLADFELLFFCLQPFLIMLLILTSLGKWLVLNPRVE